MFARYLELRKFRLWRIRRVSIFIFMKNIVIDHFDDLGFSDDLRSTFLLYHIINRYCIITMELIIYSFSIIFFFLMKL